MNPLLESFDSSSNADVSLVGFLPAILRELC
jgi:hypothetical protein